MAKAAERRKWRRAQRYTKLRAENPRMARRSLDDRVAAWMTELRYRVYRLRSEAGDQVPSAAALLRAIVAELISSGETELAALLRAEVVTLLARAIDKRLDHTTARYETTTPEKTTTPEGRS